MERDFTFVERLCARVKKVAKGSLLPHERLIYDVVIQPIQPNAYLAIYRKLYRNRWVPGASLYLSNREVVRFDCFGKEAGHMHLNADQSKWALRRQQKKLFFRESTVQAQMQRAAFELRTNVSRYLELHPRSEIQTFRLNQKHLEEACERM